MTVPEIDPTLGAQLDGAATRFGEEEFLVEGERRVSFAAAAQLVHAAARGFIAAGIERGDRVAIWAPNSIDWVIACLGFQYIGATLVPLNTRYKAAEAADVIRRSGARLLLTVSDFLEVDYVSMLRESGEELPDLEQIVVLAGPERDGTISWADFVARGEMVDEGELRTRAAAVEPDDVSDLVYTSGTTGQPKGVMLTHRQTLRTVSVWSDTLGFRRGDRYLVLNPFFHVFGYKYGWVTALMVGCVAYPLAVFDPGALLELIESESINVVPGQPTIFQGLMDHPSRPGRDLGSVRLGIVGSTSIPAKVVRDMRDVLGFTEVVTGYGLTETNGIATLFSNEDDLELVAQAVGRPIEGVEIEIFDSEGTPLPRGEEGEVVIRGYNVMKGYFEDPEQTAAAIADGWLHSGDLGYLGEDGLLRITGRLKDMVIVGGFNVYPAEIEGLLLGHPGVREAAVVGIPDERLGEVPVAFVVPREGAELEPDELRGWARERLANFKVPRSFRIVPALPYSAIGKLDKGKLREEATPSS
jgi:acyl-CoA synthetase (AMP-forming)/AMP-acid ligase II